jgi:hypothetical protein
VTTLELPRSGTGLADTLTAGAGAAAGLTVGVAKFGDLKIIEAERFEPSTVHAAGVAVYHLGNNGTDRKLLKDWPLTKD